LVRKFGNFSLSLFILPCRVFPPRALVPIARIMGTMVFHWMKKYSDRVLNNISLALGDKKIKRRLKNLKRLLRRRIGKKICIFMIYAKRKWNKLIEGYNWKGDGKVGGKEDEEVGKTETIMARPGILRGKENNLVKELKETTLSLEKLAERYGVSRQAIHAFWKRQGIKRPVRLKGHQTGECRLCQKLIQISKKSHSEFISIYTIAKETDRARATCSYHLRTLRDRGLVSQMFGRLFSKRFEKAYSMYFTKRLPINTIGQRVGIKDFQSLVQRHRELGFDVPPPFLCL